MKIYIVRHGQTEMNRAGALQGRTDLPLTGQGIAQAERLRDYFREQGIHFDRVYSSPLGRAVRTAEIAAGWSGPLVIDERLTEMDYGPYEGVDLRNPPKEIIHFFSDFVHHPAPEGMESLGSVTGRLCEFLEELKAAGELGHVLISTHAIAMKGALEYLTPSSGGSYWSRYIGNCAVYASELKGGRYLVPTQIYAGAEQDQQ